MNDETIDPEEGTTTDEAPKAPPKVGFDYRTVKLNEIQLEVADPREMSEAERRFLAASGGAMAVHGGKQVRKVIIGDEAVPPTGRFWTSLYSKYGLNTAFFKYFSHDEVFRRVSERAGSDKVRIAIERNHDTGDSRLLAATGLNKPVVVYDDLLEILRAFETDKGGVRYHDGIVVSSHTPRIGQNQFKIAGDDFSNKYELHCPVDGFGQPNVFLSLLRWICTNGAVGFANAFKTSLVLGSGGDNTRYALQRALDSFTNDEGYAMMRGKFDMATRSWASIRERQDLYRVLLGLQNDKVLQDTIGDWNKVQEDEATGGVANALLKAFDRTTGDPFQMYTADPHLMSPKKQRTLPVACKVYDLINFATELASHHVSEAGSRQLQAWVGNMISNEYDLEDSATEFDNWRDLFLSDLSKKK